MTFTFYDFPPLRGYWNLSPIIRFETTAPEPFATKESYGNADSHLRLHPGVPTAYFFLME
jgi:hypothetical protein